jgi:hypothetical protein
MLTTKERRELEAEWTDERIAATTLLMKASVLAAAAVGLLWIGLNADTREAGNAPVASSTGEVWRRADYGNTVTQAREVYEQRQAEQRARETSPVSGIARR